MDKRAWSVVGLVGGVVAMIVVWIVLTSSNDSAPAPASPPGIAGLKAHRVAAATPQELRMRDVAALRSNPAVRRIEHVGNGEPTTVGADANGAWPLDQDGLTAAVERERKDLHDCYEAALLHTPGLSDHQTLALHVAPAEGGAWATIERVDTDGDESSSPLETCLGAVLGEARFQASEPTTVRYPVVLSEQAPAAPAPAPAPVPAPAPAPEPSP